MNTILLVGLVFTFINAIAFGQKCKTPYNMAKDFPVDSGSFIIAYNISSAEKTDQSCFEALNFHGVNNDKFTFKFIQNGIRYNKTVDVKFVDHRALFIYQDDPTHILDLYDDALPNGIVVCYFCREDKEFILLAYSIDKDLSKQADQVAKQFTNNPLAYKINRDNC